MQAERGAVALFTEFVPPPMLKIEMCDFFPCNSCNIDDHAYFNLPSHISPTRMGLLAPPTENKQNRPLPAPTLVLQSGSTLFQVAPHFFKWLHTFYFLVLQTAPILVLQSESTLFLARPLQGLFATHATQYLNVL